MNAISPPVDRPPIANLNAISPPVDRPPIARTMLRESEIQHLHCAVFSDLHIGRLQIAMNDSNLVSRFETVSHLPRDGDDFI